ncbi:Pentatricopeptide repeat-containing protein [Acorus calamus]|uniref:Pentatricopeptide repeat-containing protein n=1 Tax=Acorus calamus TaxID=4465 RepID=A0AAV9EY28_ACOCL|nr:Pentatricopeptide repeat-containing protein [Acorus calamus]
MGQLENEPLKNLLDHHLGTNMSSISGTPSPNIFRTTSMISALVVESGRLSEAVDLLCSNGSSPVKPQTYSHLLQECVNRKQLFLGRRIHGQMVTVGFPADDYLTTKLLILYAKNDDLDTARKLFDRVPKRDRVPWNGGCFSGSVAILKTGEE